MFMCMCLYLGLNLKLTKAKFLAVQGYAHTAAEISHNQKVSLQMQLFLHCHQELMPFQIHSAMNNNYIN